MTVLKIIGVLLFAAFIYFVITKLNNYSLRKFNYEFFSYELSVLYFAIYGFLYFGYDLYFDAIKSDGDILNGILIFAFGVILFSIRLVLNIKISKFFKGLLFTILQFIIYLPIAAGAAIAILILFGVASQIKPVYNVNSK